MSERLEPVPELDLAPMIADMRPPSNDDVPITLDGTLLDTPDKVLAYLNEINDARPVAPTRAS